MKVFANIVLFITLYMTWAFAATPRFAPYFFWVFNPAGFFFVAVGFKEQILSLARGGGLLIFVSYVLIASFMADKIPNTKYGKKDKNGDKK
ncbi:MAG: hypothetical protein CL925_00780 [Deltaproteobacteria bacterium]|jgi:hypothetical protein|nr:hypothetical protein [Deltaproteobacteria bacterium]